MRKHRVLLLLSGLLYCFIFSSASACQDKPFSRADRRDQSRFGFHFDFNTGPARLQTEYEYDFENEGMMDWMNIFSSGVRAGMRWRSIYQFSFYLDGHFGIGWGKASLLYDHLTEQQPEGTGAVETDHNYTIYLAGVYGGFSIPLFRHKSLNTTFLTPRVVALIIELGFHALVITHNEMNAEYDFGDVNVSYESDLWSSNYGLFSAGLGIMIYFRNYLGLYAKILPGAFPVSTVVQSSNPDEVGETTYGYYHRFIFGFQLRL